MEFELTTSEKEGSNGWSTDSHLIKNAQRRKKPFGNVHRTIKLNAIQECRFLMDRFHLLLTRKIMQQKPQKQRLLREIQGFRLEHLSYRFYPNDLARRIKSNVFWCSCLKCIPPNVEYVIFNAIPSTQLGHHHHQTIREIFSNTCYCQKWAIHLFGFINWR